MVAAALGKGAIGDAEHMRIDRCCSCTHFPTTLSHMTCHPQGIGRASSSGGAGGHSGRNERGRPNSRCRGG
jgi:hypothetical protein